ncbi:DUF6701 domain-containing protein [Vibrio cortegadensis]|uniref:DUF6701 domain-containing protein n=1 Tax=Vibrio cortegadensis TaxID=1328770 RepID=UPI00352E9029
MRNKFILFTCLLSSLWLPEGNAAVNRNPQFEFGTIDSSACTLNSLAGTDHDHNSDGSNDHDKATVTCVLTFDKTYTGETPLVFVMPTIDASLSNKGTKTTKKSTEYPSTLRVHDVTNSQAVISQKIAPHRRASSTVNFVPAPMQNIDYFVIEPGVLDLSNGSRIVAGSVNTNTACGKNTNKCKPDLVNYTDFGAPNPFPGKTSEKPGVLVEIQTQENKLADGEPRWITGAANDVTKNSFNLFLERSEVGIDADIKRNEKVAFVAGLGQGYVSGLKFWLGSATTLNTTGFTEKVVQPIVDGCKIYTNFSVAFESIPTLIGTKNSRDGEDGGWLRRCDVKKDKVAFIVEEDMDDSNTKSGVERRHKQEVASFFMFEKPPAQAVCNLFPSPVQTWAGNRSSLYIDNTGEIRGAPMVGGKRYVGYHSSDINNWKKKGCDGTQCFSDTGLQPSKIVLETFRTPDAGYDSLIVKGTKTISGDLSIGRTTVEKHGKLIVNSGTYWIDNLNVLGDMIIPSGQDVLIHTKAFSIGKNAYFGIEWDSSLKEFVDAKLTVFVHDLNFSPLNPTSGAYRDRVDLANNSTFSGLLYSEIDVALSNNSAINGAVTSKSLEIHNNAYVNATNQCFTTADDYKVTMTPETDIALMCDDVPVFTINTTNNDETESLPVTVEVDPNANRFNVTAEPGFGLGSYPNFTSNSSGVLKLKVTPKNTSNISLSTNYNLSVTMDDDASQSVQSQFNFVPFKFEVPDQTVIAGKDNDVTTTVLACSDTGKTKVETYSGTPSISYEVKKPDPTLAKKGVLTYAPVFTSGDKGAREDALKISESGEFLLTLTDAKFDCTGLSGCPIDGGGKLTGSFTIKSHPWKIAICDVKAPLAGGTTKNNPGATIEENGAFIPSGELFKASLKPVVYSDNSGVDECTLATTFNYFTDTKGHSAPYAASFEVAYPSGGVLDNLAALLIGEFAHTDKDSTNNRIKTLELRWNEVGTLKMKSNAHYQSTSLVEDEESIGRFYPKYFQVVARKPISTIWNYPGNGVSEQMFSYMNQPFDGVKFKVEALNAFGNSVQNYARFSSSLMAGFSLYEPTLGDRFHSPTPNKLWELEPDDKRSVGTFTLDAITPSTTCSSELCLDKAQAKAGYEDGPFNRAGGVATRISITDVGLENADPVAYQTVTSDGGDPRLLTAQPEIRFGRAVLQDVGGVSGETIAIPLRTEYWDSSLSRFVTNKDDSQAVISGIKAKQELIWPNDSTDCDVLLNGTAAVSSGESRLINASQDCTEADGKPTKVRQQTRVWLELIKNGNQLPWLQYNWEEATDTEENPSAVVTFGINRGNDRIIFRNEPGLTN